MNQIHKIYLSACLAALFVITLTLPLPVQAASFGETLLYSAAAYAYADKQLNNLNDNHQDGMLKQTQKQTGVYQGEAENARLREISTRLMNNGLIKNKYAVYIAPDKEFNAFCTLGHVIAVNRGAMDMLDDDEVAAVLGHEMSHGEHKDPVEGTKKQLSVALAINLYLSNNANNTSYVLGTLAGNYINNEVITMEGEWNADRAGFEQATAAGYNPGGGAASMVVLRAKLGELWHEGLSKVISPNNHPKTSDRIQSFAKQLTAYSGGRVTIVNDKTVRLDGQDIVTPVASGRYLAAERAYLVAGNLARYFHSNKTGEAYAGEDGILYVNGTKIMTPAAEDEPAEVIAARINSKING